MPKRILNAVIIVITCLVSSAALPLNMDGVVAYPVPFNPNTQTLKIENKGSVITVNSVKVEIYDINGDRVLTRNYSGLGLNDIIWNGRNGSGRKVKPGLYIIKITAEDSASGDFGRKIIRILVDY